MVAIPLQTEADDALTYVSNKIEQFFITIWSVMKRQARKTRGSKLEHNLKKRLV